MLKVLLIQKVDGLGKKGEIVQVKTGYAQNYLIPMKLGSIASESDIKKHEEALETRKREVDVNIVKIDDSIKRLAKKRMSLHCKANEAGTLYAAVTQEEIRGALYETYGAEVPEEAILFDTIKSVGLHPFKIIFKNKGEVKMKVKVLPSTSHAPRDK